MLGVLCKYNSDECLLLPYFLNTRNGYDKKWRPILEDPGKVMRFDDLYLHSTKKVMEQITFFLLMYWKGSERSQRHFFFSDINWKLPLPWLRCMKVKAWGEVTVIKQKSKFISAWTIFRKNHFKKVQIIFVKTPRYPGWPNLRKMRQNITKNKRSTLGTICCWSMWKKNERENEIQLNFMLTEFRLTILWNDCRPELEA